MYRLLGIVGAERFEVLFFDITIRKAAEERMRQSEERFRTFLQSMPNHVWTFGADGLLYWLNDQVFAYSGMTSEELSGSGWVGMVHPDDIEPTSDAWNAAKTSAQNYQTEFRLRRNDGAYRWHIACAVSVLSANGGALHWIGTNTDIDDQKKAEVALVDSAAYLEVRVAEQTAQRWCRDSCPVAASRHWLDRFRPLYPGRGGNQRHKAAR